MENEKKAGNAGTEDSTSGEATAQRGRDAIDAQQAANPKSDDDRKEDNKKDAEQWRNEG